MFNGFNLRLARLYHELSLEQVAERVSKTRQYIQRLETGIAVPTSVLAKELAVALKVTPEFFRLQEPQRVNEELVHFRKREGTRVSTRLSTLAKAELYGRLITLLDRQLELPPVCFQEITAHTPEEIEVAAEKCRVDWGLGLGPIDNVTRLAEKLGAFVTSFDSLSDEVDALSVPLERPFIVRNRAKKSACHQRFDIAHEIAHLILHSGITTGDRATESQANRFASALLLPRAAMASFFPSPVGGRINWKGLSEFKLTWKVSKAAIVYRAHQLGLLTDAQYKTAFTALKRKGEAIDEKEDSLIVSEKPEFLPSALNFLYENMNVDKAAVAQALAITPCLLDELTEVAAPEGDIRYGENVVYLSGYIKNIS